MRTNWLIRPATLAFLVTGPLRLANAQQPTTATRAPAAPPRATAPQQLALVARDFGFIGPTRLASGLTVVSLRNEGSKLHHAQLVRLEGKQQIGDLFGALSRARGIRGLPSWATLVGGPSAALPGRTITSQVQLDPGRYAVVCWVPAPDGAPHFMKGMLLPLEVVDSNTSRPSRPVASAIVRLEDYAFKFAPPAKAGPMSLRIENAGSQPHEFLVVRLAEGKSVEDVASWAEKGQVGPAPARSWEGVAALAPGRSAWLTIDFVPGRYVVFCLSPDIRDGRPHLLHEMQRSFEVPAR